LSDGEARRWFIEMDSDEDGKISLSEFFLKIHQKRTEAMDLQAENHGNILSSSQVSSAATAHGTSLANLQNPAIVKTEKSGNTNISTEDNSAFSSRPKVKKTRFEKRRFSAAVRDFESQIQNIEEYPSYTNSDDEAGGGPEAEDRPLSGTRDEGNESSAVKSDWELWLEEEAVRVEDERLAENVTTHSEKRDAAFNEAKERKYIESILGEAVQAKKEHDAKKQNERANASQKLVDNSMKLKLAMAEATKAMEGSEPATHEGLPSAQEVLTKMRSRRKTWTEKAEERRKLEGH